MTESSLHIELVSIIECAIRKLVSEDNWSLIAVDSAKSKHLPRRMAEGFIPDVLYDFDGLLIIGEAKTGKDVDRDHSKKQYASYVKKCKAFTGEAYIIVAVPWTERITATNLLKQICRNENWTSSHLIVLDNVK